MRISSAVTAACALVLLSMSGCAVDDTSATADDVASQTSAVTGDEGTGPSDEDMRISLELEGACHKACSTTYRSATAACPPNWSQCDTDALTAANACDDYCVTIFRQNSGGL